MDASEPILTMRPRPLAQQQRRGRLAAEKGALQVHIDHPVPLRLADIRQPVEGDDTGRIDQRVQAAETLLAGRHRRRRRLRRRYIQFDGQQIIAVQAAFGILQTRSIDIPDRDLRAARQQRLRNRQPEAARPTGDQRPAPGTLDI